MYYMYTTKFNEIQWHPVAIFGTTPKQNINFCDINFKFGT